MKTQVVVRQDPAPVLPPTEKKEDEKGGEEKPNSKLRLNKLPKDEKVWTKERPFPTAKGWADWLEMKLKSGAAMQKRGFDKVLSAARRARRRSLRPQELVNDVLVPVSRLHVVHVDHGVVVASRGLPGGHGQSRSRGPRARGPSHATFRRAFAGASRRRSGS